MAARPRERRGGGWEGTALRVLGYPANLALAGVVAFLVAVPLVTAFPAAVALARALARWQDDGDDAVATNVVRELRATWRRTWRTGVLVGVALVLLTVDVLFLVAQLSTPSAGAAVVLGGATVPVVCVVALVLLLVPVAVAGDPDGDVRTWLRGAAGLAARRPLRVVGTLALGGLVAATCVALPTLAPFFLMSLPLDLALRAWPRASTAG
ncbi:putative membrane protein YesL [Sediminihabitans luteus]|uniref:Putative membrane protein YesL n=1 Tax=Sediminihabitans luteus TaxID=1138585 RepID=A0A2M9D1K1_9CELL|nr:DUF624 domain-containing protein [Sediminihabitans luteus]PJJ77955.1 putative membrane protein YesL [Sediminihabitans luteus]GIJ00584.1 hypothetical protein Slu03_29610 [Sediminihabitans luteus]